ncbi:unnamed protein product [Moneuplotes crassus]|uniref:Uncharacterized protein n=1 Tax=Euplotes crassus TaxID=5936 RepID=A0AAD1U8F6_EUPCR|nr:unnamed protein product [Moneuplotes crassus]
MKSVCADSHILQGHTWLSLGCKPSCLVKRIELLLNSYEIGMNKRIDSYMRN